MKQSSPKEFDNQISAVSWIVNFLFGLFKFVFLLAVAFGVVFYGFSIGLFDLNFSHVDYELITTDVILLFEKYDTNADGKLSLHEFEPLAHNFLNSKVTFNPVKYCELISYQRKFFISLILF